MSSKLIYTLLIALVVCCGFYAFKPREKTGYVQIQKVFNDFAYKQEMELKLKKVEETRKKELDSLETILKGLYRDAELNTKDVLKTARFEDSREAFLKKKKAYDADMQEAISHYDEIIIKQMNQYVKEYGEVYKYKYIFGTDGKGSLMFADTISDLTSEVVDFINKKYKGQVTK